MLLGNDDGSSPLGQPGSSSEMLLLYYYTIPKNTWNKKIRKSKYTLYNNKTKKYKEFFKSRKWLSNSTIASWRPVT